MRTPFKFFTVAVITIAVTGTVGAGGVRLLLSAQLTPPYTIVKKPTIISNTWVNVKTAEMTSPELVYAAWAPMPNVPPSVTWVFSAATNRQHAVYVAFTPIKPSDMDTGARYEIDYGGQAPLIVNVSQVTAPADKIFVGKKWKLLEKVTPVTGTIKVTLRPGTGRTSLGKPQFTQAGQAAVELLAGSTTSPSLAPPAVAPIALNPVPTPAATTSPVSPDGTYCGDGIVQYQEEEFCDSGYIIRGLQPGTINGCTARCENEYQTPPTLPPPTPVPPVQPTPPVLPPPVTPVPVPVPVPVPPVVPPVLPPQQPISGQVTNLSLEIAPVQSVLPGANLTVQLTVRNNGAQAAERVEVLLATSREALMMTTGSDTSCTVTDGYLTCGGQALAAGASKTITVIFSGTQSLLCGDRVQFWSRAQSAADDENPDDNDADTSVRMACAPYAEPPEQPQVPCGNGACSSDETFASCPADCMNPVLCPAQECEPLGPNCQYTGTPYLDQSGCPADCGDPVCN